MKSGWHSGNSATAENVTIIIYYTSNIIYRTNEMELAQREQCLRRKCNNNIILYQ